LSVEPAALHSAAKNIIYFIERTDSTYGGQRGTSSLLSYDVTQSTCAA